MEYEIENELNYTTPHIRATLDLKKMNKKAKNKRHGRKSLQGGWGMGSKEPIQNYFYYQWLQYQKNDMIPLDSYTE